MILAALLAATLAVDAHRPISDLAAELMKQNPDVVITYEEAGWAVEDTEQIDDGPVHMRAPRKAVVTFTYDAATPYPDLLEALVAQAHAAGVPGTFRVEGRGSIYHIVPKRESVLDTLVTLEDKERTVDETLDEILPQLPYSVGWGFTPLNLFVQTKVRTAATDEPARSVLRRVIIEVSKQRPYHVTWQLNHDPFMDRYVFNFTFAPSRSAVAPAPAATPERLAPPHS